MHLGNLVDKVIKVDGTTITTTQGNFSQVCVEIDLLKRLVSFVVVICHLHSVEYKGMYQICFRYSKYGCRDKDCTKLETNDENLPKETDGNDKTLGLDLRDKGLEGGKFGLWMIPKKQVHRRKNERSNEMPVSDRKENFMFKERGSSLGDSNDQSRP